MCRRLTHSETISIIVLTQGAVLFFDAGSLQAVVSQSWHESSDSAFIFASSVTHSYTHFKATQHDPDCNKCLRHSQTEAREREKQVKKEKKGR